MTTKTTHTQGPWMYSPLCDGFAIYSGNPLLPEVGKTDYPKIVEGIKSEGDARLIAAAPDLLSACGDAWRALSGHTDEWARYALDSIDAAIARAEAK